MHTGTHVVYENIDTHRCITVRTEYDIKTQLLHEHTKKHAYMHTDKTNVHAYVAQTHQPDCAEPETASRAGPTFDPPSSADRIPPLDPNKLCLNTFIQL